MRSTGGTRRITAFCGCPFGDEEEPVLPIEFNPWAQQIPQVYNWTCSACATEWLERAMNCARGPDIYTNRESMVSDIGYPGNINAQYGLMDGSGSQLRRVLEDIDNIETEHNWLDFDTAYQIYSETPGLMSGQGWYHWVGVRGVQGSNLWVANSAPNYMGITDVVSRYDYERLGGFSNIWVTN